MKRTLCTLTVGAVLAALTACTAEAPSGVTLDPLTVSSSPISGSSPAVTTVSATESSSAAPTTADATSEAPTSEATFEAPTSAPVEVTVPPEASALPLPTEQINVPADNPQEEADRAAIEAVWRQSWDLIQHGYDMQPEIVAKTSAGLLGEPVKTNVLDGLASGEQRGVTTYGSIELHPYWYQPVAGLSYAALGDCSDFSNFGEMDRASGAEKSRGTKDLNRAGYFVKIPDGSWRLWQIINVTDQMCKTS